VHFGLFSPKSSPSAVAVGAKSKPLGRTSAPAG
jgi:hypothetical protein